MQCIIANLNGSQAFNLTVPVNILKRCKVQLFLFEDFIVAELVSGLSVVELVLEDANFSI